MRALFASIVTLPIFAAALDAAAQAPRSAEPTAIVEEAPAGVELEALDFVSPGRAIRLAAGQRLVLGYVRSCLRETIVGGTVTVGEQRSEVAGGEAKRDKVECDGGRLRLGPAQAGAAATVVFRDPVTGENRLPAARITLHGRAPLVELSPVAPLTIERLDAPGESLRFAALPADLARGRFLDLGPRGIDLAPGGLYRAQAGGRGVVFRVAPTARPAPSPLLGRLLRL